MSRTHETTLAALTLFLALLALLSGNAVAQTEHLVDSGTVFNNGWGELDSVRVTGGGNFQHGLLSEQTIKSISLESGTATNFEKGTVGTVEMSGGDFSNRGKIIVGGTVSGGTFMNNAGGSVTRLDQIAGTVHNSGNVTEMTLRDAGTFNNLSGSTLGSLEMFGGTVSNASSMGHLIYAGGKYSGNGTLDTLTLAGDANGIDWGNVGNLQFSSNGLGRMTISAFADDADFGFTAPMKAGSVHLADGNLAFDLSGLGEFDRDFASLFFADGISLRDVFGTDEVTGMANSISVAWDDWSFSIFADEAFAQGWSYSEAFLSWDGTALAWTNDSSVPEPATLAIFGLGLAGLGLA